MATLTTPIKSHFELPVMKLPFRNPAPWKIHTAPTRVSRIPTVATAQRIYQE